MTVKFLCMLCRMVSLLSVHYFLRSFYTSVSYNVLNQIIAGRHLVKTGRGIASPFVEVEIVGADYDIQKYKTNTVSKYIVHSDLYEVFHIS